MSYKVIFVFARRDGSEIKRYEMPDAVIPRRKDIVNMDDIHYGKVADVQHRYAAGQLEVYVNVDSWK